MATMTPPTPAPESMTFSAAEAAVYDRQMRLWGVEAQKRLQTSRVLVSGLSALGSELVKNLVLSGMSVTVHDPAVVSPMAIATQFFFQGEDLGRNRAEASLARIRELNPLVTVDSETRPLEDLPCAFFHGFTVICLIGATATDERRIDDLARERGIAFFAARSFGFDGVVFADLGPKHQYRLTPVGDSTVASTGTTNEPLTVAFPSYAEAQAVPWSSLQSTRKRGPQIPRVFIKHQLLQRYRHARGLGHVDATRADDFVAFAQEQLQVEGLAVDFFDEPALRDLAAVADVDLVPACAILAGILGQEVVKAISQKDEPICNYFCFDGATGLVRRIG